MLLDDVNECVLIWSDMFIKIAEAFDEFRDVLKTAANYFMHFKRYNLVSKQ